jgi:alpha-L-fucosidase 2
MFENSPEDPGLIALYVQYGRYLMMSSSRPGTQPANLQGIWNQDLEPAWGSKYTCNINLEMNYWMSTISNLADCQEPLFKLIEEVAESGKITAREHYNARGWVLHHNTDLWRGTAPINHANHGIWVGGSGWLCRHLWEHYLFSQDVAFLRSKAYPLMKGAAQFYLDYLVEDPNTKWLISSPSNSPETGGLVQGPTMDHQIIRALFRACIESSKILENDEAFAEELTKTLLKIVPNQIGKHGQLQEWLADIDDPDNHHRHVSHLWGVHPGSEINYDDDPELMQAAKQSLLFRGDEGTGWSLAWKINFWARFLDGDHAYELIKLLFRPAEDKGTNYRRGGSYMNLFDAHPPFQIDGNFGAPSGIIELLVQSHLNRIDILPALPSALPNGHISGVKARGGFTLDFAWEKGQLTTIKITSEAGNPCLIKYGDKQISFKTEKAETYRLNIKLEIKG